MTQVGKPAYVNKRMFYLHRRCKPLLEKEGPAGKAWCGNGFVVAERAAFSKSVPN